MSNRLRIGVLRGGPSSEYEVSLKTGAAVLQALRDKLSERYKARDIFIDRDSIWHIDGLAFSPADALARFDVAFNALHGAYGEDGRVQGILEAHGIPFTGSDSASSAIGMSKVLTKHVLAKHGIKSPYWKTISSDSVIKDKTAAANLLFQTFILPAVIKPSTGGSSVGISIVRDRAELEPALIKAAEHGPSIIIEEFIPGMEATCGVIEGFRSQALYALPVVEIRPKNAFFDYEAKYAGKSDEIVPATFLECVRKDIERLAMKVHEALGLRHYSRTDFIIHPRRGIYVLETNTLPGLTNESLMPKSLRAVGSDLPEFVDHIIKLTL
jgi:D-alanine-D-alanine ligase